MHKVTLNLSDELYNMAVEFGTKAAGFETVEKFIESAIEYAIVGMDMAYSALADNLRTAIEKEVNNIGEKPAK